MRTHAARLLAPLGGLLAVLAFFASPALAAEPWWQLISGARPTYLHADPSKRVPGVNEVQEITVPLKEFEGNPEQGGLSLHVSKTPRGEFITEPTASNPEFSLTPLTLENLRKALEGAYGAGNVTVTERPHVAGVLSYEVETAAGVPAVEVGGIGLEPAPSAKITVPGKAPVSDGEIAVTAENLGDAAVNGEPGGGGTVHLTDSLPAGLEATSIAGDETPTEGGVQGALSHPLKCVLATLSCEFVGVLPPYVAIEMRIAVNVKEGARSGEENHVSVTGGALPRPPLRGRSCSVTPRPRSGSKNCAPASKNRAGRRTRGPDRTRSR